MQFLQFFPTITSLNVLRLYELAKEARHKGAVVWLCLYIKYIVVNTKL